MSLERVVGRVFAKCASNSKKASLAPTEGYKRLLEGPKAPQHFYRKFIAPWYFKIFSGPFERWQHACLTRYLREHGKLMRRMDPEG